MSIRTTDRGHPVTMLGLSALFALPLTAQSQAVLEEVIVTAQKRTESLQDVPISVTALQGDQIDSAGIANMAALSDYIPNLIISDAPVSTNIYMRGMGSSNNQAFEQSVGMYIDGVYMGRGRQYRSPFMDIERVEVLRGPQGTLFGKNTVAGAINVITATPSMGEEFNGNASVSAESNDGYIYEGVLSGAVSDTVALRGAIKYRENDGYMENVFLNDEEAQIEETVFRVTGAWEPTDTLYAVLKYGRSDYKREGVASGTNVYLDPQERAELFPNLSTFAIAAYSVTDALFPDFGQIASEEWTMAKDNGFGPSGGADGVGIGINPESSDNETDNAVLNVEWDIGQATITSITGYSAYDYTDGCDCDWLPLQFIARDDDQSFDQYSQEFRFTSPGGEFFDYIAGAYYEVNTLKFRREVTIDGSLGGELQPVLGIPSIASFLTGGAYDADQLRRTHDFKQDSDAWALFGQGTFNLTDTLRLTLGLRYTQETKEVESSQFLSDDITGLDTPSQNFFLAQIQATQFDTYLYDYKEDRDTDAWLPSVNVQWDVTDNSMLYVSWSEGFKSGGFTGADDGAPGDLGSREFPCEQGQPIDQCYDPTNPADDFEFDDEEVSAWEIGGKHTLLSGAMTANWAAFYTEYDDLQTSIFKGISFGVTNAAEVTVQGLEFELLWQATEDLRLGLNGAWLDAEYDAYPTAPCTAIQLDADILCGQPGGTTNNDLAGENTTYAPEYTAAFYFDYDRLMNNGWEFFFSGEANYSDEFDTQGDLDPIDRVDSFTKVNARFGVRGVDQRWELMLYGRNLTDEEVAIYSFDVPVLAGSHAAMFDEERVYGARLRWNF
ncbi:MAG: TonB-dependent receptor [Pseudomonadota bacterium]